MPKTDQKEETQKKKKKEKKEEKQDGQQETVKSQESAQKNIFRNLFGKKTQKETKDDQTKNKHANEHGNSFNPKNDGKSREVNSDKLTDGSPFAEARKSPQGEDNTRKKSKKSIEEKYPEQGGKNRPSQTNKNASGRSQRETSYGNDTQQKQRPTIPEIKDDYENKQKPKAKSGSAVPVQTQTYDPEPRFKSPYKNIIGSVPDEDDEDLLTLFRNASTRLSPNQRNSQPFVDFAKKKSIADDNLRESKRSRDGTPNAKKASLDQKKRLGRPSEDERASNETKTPDVTVPNADNVKEKRSASVKNELQEAENVPGSKYQESPSQSKDEKATDSRVTPKEDQANLRLKSTLEEKYGREVLGGSSKQHKSLSTDANAIAQEENTNAVDRSMGVESASPDDELDKRSKRKKKSKSENQLSPSANGADTRASPKDKKKLDKLEKKRKQEETKEMKKKCKDLKQESQKKIKEVQEEKKKIIEGIKDERDKELKAISDHMGKSGSQQLGIAEEQKHHLPNPSTASIDVAVESSSVIQFNQGSVQNLMKKSRSYLTVLHPSTRGLAGKMRKLYNYTRSTAYNYLMGVANYVYVRSKVRAVWKHVKKRIARKALVYGVRKLIEGFRKRANLVTEYVFDAITINWQMKAGGVTAVVLFYLFWRYSVFDMLANPMSSAPGEPPNGEPPNDYDDHIMFDSFEGNPGVLR